MDTEPQKSILADLNVTGVDLDRISGLSIDDSITLDLSPHGAAAQPIYSIDMGSGTMFNNWTAGTITTTTIGAGGTGSTLGAGSLDWQSYGIKSPVTLNQNGSIDLRGDRADIVINGVSLSETLRTLQERMNMLVPDPRMEQEWDELRELREAYEHKLAQCREKSRMWDRLKSMPPPEKL